MANEMKAADLIGKVIIVGENIATITIKGVKDNGMLDGEFKRGDAEPMAMAVSMQNLEAQVEKGTWKIAGEAIESVSEPVPDVTIEEVEDIIPAKPVAKPEPTEKPTAEIKPIKPEAKTKSKPKSKAKSKAKSEKPATTTATAGAKYAYEAYTSSKGKACARILGFSETDAAYQHAKEINGSASYTKDKQGNKTYFVAFGPIYAAAAKEICDMLNDGKYNLGTAKIVMAAAYDKHRERKAERRANASTSEAVTMDEKERETYELFKKFLAGDPEAIALVEERAKKAA